MTASPFLRFAFVGGLGLLVDLAMLWLCLNVVKLDVYSARLASFAVTVTFTWALNRQVTFGSMRARGWAETGREWLRFVAVNAIGLLVNYAVYAILVTYSGDRPGSPYFAAACGSAAGLLFNYAATARFVFGVRTGRTRGHDQPDSFPNSMQAPLTIRRSQNVP